MVSTNGQCSGPALKIYHLEPNTWGFPPTTPPASTQSNHVLFGQRKSLWINVPVGLSGRGRRDSSTSEWGVLQISSLSSWLLAVGENLSADQNREHSAWKFSWNGSGWWSCQESLLQNSISFGLFKMSCKNPFISRIHFCRFAMASCLSYDWLMLVVNMFLWREGLLYYLGPIRYRWRIKLWFMRAMHHGNCWLMQHQACIRSPSSPQFCVCFSIS